MVHLFQFRIAWYEQTVLRILRIPHSISNSAYIATESTGALPYLKDSKRGVFVGRRHPGMQGRSFDSWSHGNSDSLESNSFTSTSTSVGGSDIVSYLKGIELDPDAHLSADERNDSMAYSSIICNQLQPLLNALIFADVDKYESTHKDLTLEACLGVRGQWKYFKMLSRFQAWSEKLTILSKLKKNDQISCSGRTLVQGRYRVDVSETLKSITQIFSAFNSRLANRSFIASSTHPSSVDALLFSCLCESLGDAHLISILPQFHHLCSFFAMLYKKFYSEFSLANEDVNELMKQNNYTNVSNIFYQNLLENFNSIQFVEDIMTVKEAALADKGAGVNWERFRLGGNLLKRKQTHSNVDVYETPNNKEKDKLIKKNEESDSMWWSSVVVASALFFAVFNGSGSLANE